MLRLLHRVEDAALVSFVLMLVVLQLLQIVLRNIVGGGLDWAEPATQILVLWIAWLGAVRASREGQHVAVDIIAHYTRGDVKLVVTMIALIFSAGASLTAAWFCGSFVVTEYKEDTRGLLNMPMWCYEFVIPSALTLIGLRFVRQTIRLGMNRNAIG